MVGKAGWAALEAITHSEPAVAQNAEVAEAERILGRKKHASCTHSESGAGLVMMAWRVASQAARQ